MSTLADRLRERILAGDAEPGRPIRQDALAAELGVSKIPLREAMTRLEREGLVRTEPNRGWFVQPLSATEASEVYALRLQLEPDLAALASSQAADAEREAARAALELLERGGEAGALNRAFHLALVRPANRPLTVDIIERLHILSERYVRKHLEPRGRDTRARVEHRRLLAVWLARERDAVADLLRAHIHETQRDLERQLGTP